MKFIRLLTLSAALWGSLAAPMHGARPLSVPVIWGQEKYDSRDFDQPITQIRAGAQHTLAVKEDGSVIAWGYNGDGQLDVPVAAKSGVTAVAAGHYHSLALKEDGSVIAWGNSGDGRTNVPSAALSGVTAIAGGYTHSLALKEDGSVIGWGSNAYGQTTVPAAALSNVIAIAAGNYHSLALKADGSVIGWGANWFFQTDIPTSGLSGVTAISAGGNHSLALKADGSVIAWGENDGGQRNVPAAALSGVTAIGSGNSHNLALKEDGSVIAWGYYGIGAGTVTASALSGVTSIEAGGYHNIAIKEDGSIISWGSSGSVVTMTPASVSGLIKLIANNQGYLGLKADGSVYSGIDQTNVPEDFRSGVRDIATGGEHTLGLKENGSVVGWRGFMSWNGEATIPDAAMSGVTAIAASYNNSVALKDGSVIVWGADWNGQTSVPLAAQSGVTAIAAGYSYIMALNNGSVIAWGNNDNGQSIVPEAALSGVTAIAAGWNHCLALKSDGSVIAWGNNVNGQVTVPVAAQSGVTAISAGFNYSMALKEDGSVIAWGDNSYGQTNVPAGLNNVTAIYAAGSRNIAMVPSAEAEPEPVLVAELVVEQPTGAELANGGSQDFGSVVRGTSSSLTFTVKNTGTDVLRLTRVSGKYALLSGPNAADFTVTQQPAAQVAALTGETSFTVRYAPLSPGARTATLTLQSNDADASPYTLTLTGEATNPPGVGVEWTSNLTDSGRTWRSIASSSDGSRLVAAAQNGSLYTSANGGADWTEQTAAGTRNWFSVASSADGSKLAAAVKNGAIYTSADSGATWTAQTAAGSRNWQSLASSTDGSKLAAAVSNGILYTSADSGATWTARMSDSNRLWTAIASSWDGSHLVAATSSRLFTSTDSGVTWTQRMGDSNRFWQAVASSRDGSRLAAVVNGGGLYTSADAGETWTEQTAAGSRVWWAIASSADGSRLAAVVNGGHIYSSLDAGLTWTARVTDSNRDWQAIASSTDGSRLAAVAANGHVWTSAGAENAPEISVQQPVGSDLLTGAQRDFGVVTVGARPTMVFTLKNTGLADLTGLKITKDGPDAGDFFVTGAMPKALNGPGGSVNFTVRFTPSAGGPRSAVLHIASNDADESPFDIQLTGEGILSQTIAFAQPASVFFTETLPLVATASSGLPVALRVVSGPGEISGGNLTFTASGSVLVEATQEGNGSYLPAKPVQRRITAKNVRPVLSPVILEDAIVSLTVSQTLSATMNPTSFAATGLPPGVKLNTKTGLLNGKPTVEGDFTVVFTASNSGGKSDPVTVSWTVLPLPGTAVGSFTGLVERSSSLSYDATQKLSGLGGIITLKSTVKGSFTGMLTLETKAHSFRGVFDATVEGNPSGSVTVKRKSAPSLVLAFSINKVTGQLVGTLTDNLIPTPVALSAWRNVWSTTSPATAYEGTYTALLEIPSGLQGISLYPQGNGYGTLKVTSTGTARWAGRTADGTYITASTITGPNGQVPLYRRLYTTVNSTAGSLHGWMQIDGSNGNLDGLLAWKKQELTTGTSRAYRLGFPAHHLTVIGGSYTAPASGDILLDLPDEAGNASLTFTEGSLDTATLTQDTGGQLTQIFQITTAHKALMPRTTASNPGKVSLMLSPATGSISGKLTANDPNPLGSGTVTRSATYYGVAVQRLNQAAGYFLMASLPEEGPPATTLKTSPQMSGQVILEAAAED